MSGTQQKPLKAEVKVDDAQNDQQLNQWVMNLYNSVSQLGEQELIAIYNSVKYQGFDRNEILKELMKLGLSKQLLAEVVLVCALRGPKAASQVPLSDGKTLLARGVRASGAKGGKGITCARITASTADLAAFLMKKMNVPKRIANSECPAWLQFPAAGAIKMPDDIRKHHRAFSIEFSTRIKGAFNEDIYNTMMDNSYLDQSLKLFQ